MGNVCSFLVKVVVVLSCAISVTNADFSSNLLNAPAQSPIEAPEGASAVSDPPLPSNLPLIHRPRQRHFSPHSAPTIVAPAQPPLYGPLITASHPPTSSHLSKPLMKRSASVPPGADLPNIAPTQISPGAIAAGLARPPLSPEVSSKIFYKSFFHKLYSIFFFMLSLPITTQHLLYHFYASCESGGSILSICCLY